MNTKAIGWPKWRVLSEIYARGMTLNQLAIHNNRNPTSFSHVWKRPNFINQQIIADFIGCKPEDIWPERYPKDSHRIYDSKRHGIAQRRKHISDTNTNVEHVAA